MKSINTKVFKENTNLILKRISKVGPMKLSMGKKEFVIMSKAEYDSLAETLYLLSTPANTKRLLEGIEQAKAIKN